MKKIINTAEDFVDEFVEGIVLAHPDALRLVGGDRRGIVRADAPVRGKVGIVTGGGSGHLPAFLGYVGPGVLDGAAIGNVFSSPSAEQIARVTRAVDGGVGVLYLYGNYGGDVYNFDIAADLVSADGIVTRTVLEADDVASAPAAARATRRGVAGMVYAFTIAGASAERGDDLDTVARIAQKVGDRTRSMGVGLSPTILPTAGEPTFELQDGEMELGIGIHGEPGISRRALASADDIADSLLDGILDDLDLGDDGTDHRVSVLVNGMGATPLEELYVLFRRVSDRLTSRGIAIRAPFVGNYVTSLEMAGASVSILLLDDELEQLLEQPSWTPFFRHASGPGTASLEVGSGPVEAGSDNEATDTAIDHSADDPSDLGRILLALLPALPAHADLLRDLDAALGDGDLGITVSAGSLAALDTVRLDPAAADAEMLRRSGAAFASANPSTFAALVGGAVIAASNALGDDGVTAPGQALVWARRVSAEIAARGGAEPGDKTVLDALDPSLDALERSLDAPVAEIVSNMLAAASAAVDRLASEPSGRGRAAWLRERSRGLQDPGMVAYREILRDLAATFARLNDDSK